MTIEEKRAKYRAFYYKHHERHRAKARERENLERVNETTEQREKRLTYLRGYQAKKRLEKLQAMPIEDRPPNLSEMSPAQLHQFGVIVLAILESKHQAKLAHRRQLRLHNVDTRRLKEKVYRENRRALLPPKKAKLSDEELRNRRLARDRIKQKDWRLKLRISNPEAYSKLQKRQAEYERKRRQTNPRYHVRYVLSKKIYTAIHRQQQGKKTFNTMELLGCPIEQLMRHLESKWTAGMNWQNFGRGAGKWVIDHLRPRRLCGHDRSSAAKTRVQLEEFSAFVVSGELFQKLSLARSPLASRRSRLQTYPNSTKSALRCLRATS